MGAYTCEYGIVHKRCRCPQPHTIKCDNATEHAWTTRVPHGGERECLVLSQRKNSGAMGKHEAHDAHEWWYTSWGGGHQMNSYDPVSDKNEKNVKQWSCPGA